MRHPQSCDVLIVGSGGAGLRAAIAAWEADPALDVVVLTKGDLGRTGATANSYSDRMAFHVTLPGTEPGGPDNWRHHADDIYRIGGGVSDADLAEILARRSADAFDYLDRLGVPFARRPDGRPDQFVTDGSEYARACYTGPDTAHQIEGALLNRLQDTGVRVTEHYLAADLLTAGGRVSGVVAVSEPTGEPSVILAWAVVLATGGAGEVFDVHVYPPGMTGGSGAGQPRVHSDRAVIGRHQARVFGQHDARSAPVRSRREDHRARSQPGVRQGRRLAGIGRGADSRHRRRRVPRAGRRPPGVA
jgi:succinate dehydrogenase/fumarate reductase flavoprotein subunit